MWWFLVHQLRSRDASARRKAAAALAESRPRGAFRALVEATHDEDPVVRASCVTALAQYQDERRIQPLVDAMLDPDPEVVKAALSALRKNTDPRVVPPASRLIRHRVAAVRSVAAQILEQHGWQPRDQEELSWWHVARGQFSKAASLGAAAIPPIESAIENGPFSVAVAAVQALAEAGGAHALRPLLAALKSPDAIVCVAALEALARTGLAEGRPAVQAMLRHRESRVRAAAAETSGLMNITESVPEVEVLLKDASWEVRRSAAESLGKLRDPRSVVALSSALHDPDEDVQQMAAMALGNLRNRGAIPALVFALASPSSGLRRLAAAALARIEENWSSTMEAQAAAEQVRASIAGADADSKFFFEQLFNAGGPASRIRTSTPPAEVRTPGTNLEADQRHKLAVNTLLGLLTERDPVLRQAAVEAFGRLRERRAESAVARLLADPDSSVSAAAAEAAQQIQAS